VPEPIESRSPATGEPLGSVPAATAEDLRAAAARGAEVQPLWAAVPAAARARYVRRTAQAILDDLDDLALLLARETGRPRTEALLGELLPAVAGLNALADDGPGVLADRRLGRPALLRGGRRATGVQSPRGVAGILGGGAAPWAETALEVGAALLAGNATVLVPAAPLAGERLRSVFLRAGVPDELLAVAHGPAAAAALPEAVNRTVSVAAATAKGTMLVLGGADVERVAAGALWAAFGAGGRHPAAVGLLVTVPSMADPLVQAIALRARRLLVGDPALPGTEIGPLDSREDLATVEALVAEAVAEGAELLCGGPAPVPGLAGAFYAPAVLRRVPPGARLLREPAPGPVLAVVEAASEAEAIALAAAPAPAQRDRRARGRAVSVWAGDRPKGERVARTLGVELAWVNEHGVVAPGPALRLARHVAPRQIASRPARLPAAHRLPYDPSLVQARTAATQLAHGPDRERAAVLRRNALPLARAAARVARELVRR
jgi:acyl-CoA reductase-like NAD-dependent aldehyde dehydrogenase